MYQEVTFYHPYRNSTVDITIWLIVTRYVSQTWSETYSPRFPVLSSDSTFTGFDLRGNMTGDAGVAEHSYPSGAPGVTLGFYGSSYCPSFSFLCLCFDVRSFKCSLMFLCFPHSCLLFWIFDFRLFVLTRLLGILPFIWIYEKEQFWKK